MSRYNIPAKDASRYSCTVGYDNPLQTFFCQIYDNEAVDYNNSIDWVANPDHEEKEELIFSNGYMSHEIPTVKDLEEVLSPWAIMTDNIKSMLITDQQSSPGPNKFQKRMVNLVEGLMKKSV